MRSDEGWPLSHRDEGLAAGCPAGMIEYWTGEGHAFPSEGVDFSSKLDTDLYVLAKAKTGVHSLEVSRNGTQFATFSSDRCWRTHVLHGIW